jgi:F-type H+-transporting ATPase subunit gamma
METLETLGKRIATTEDLRSIVRTMKSLSAVSIRQYEQAVGALRDYNRTIELGLQVVLKSGRPPVAEAEAPDRPTIAIVFGSDHGLCGRFNRQVAGFARDELRRRKIARENAVYLVAGERAATQLEAAGERVERILRLPGSVGGLTETAHDILLEIDERQAQRSSAGVLLFHNRRTEEATAAPRAVQLLPLAAGWLRQLAGRPWRSRTLPTFTMDAEALFGALVRQHLLIGIFRAGAESAASEHAMRLSAMQAAERNIEEHLGDMSAAYRRKRQDSITEELLDVVAGFEVLTTADEFGVTGEPRGAR